MVHAWLASGCGALATAHPGTPPRFLLGTTVIDGVRSTYADVPEAQPVVYVGSGGRLEIAVRNGDAGRALNARVGTTVRMARRPGRINRECGS